MNKKATEEEATSKDSSEKQEDPAEETSEQPSGKDKQIDPPKKRLLVGGLAVLILLLGLGYSFKHLFIAAMVNGRPIPRWTVVKELEKQGGNQVLNTLVSEQLLVQKAEQKGISVSDTELEQEMQKIEKSVSGQGQNLDQLLQAQGLTREELKKQTRSQLILEKLLGDKIAVSEKDIDEYLEENREQLPESTSETALREQVKSELERQKLSKQAQQYLQKLRQSADITTFVNY